MRCEYEGCAHRPTLGLRRSALQSTHVRQFHFLVILWDREIVVTQSILLHRRECRRDLISSGGDDRLDRQTWEIPIVRHLRIGRPPNCRINGLQLFENGGAIRIFRGDPVTGFELRRLVNVLFRIVTVDDFFLAGGRELRFLASFLLLVLAAELAGHFHSSLHFLSRHAHHDFLIVHQVNHFAGFSIDYRRHLRINIDPCLVALDLHGHPPDRTDAFHFLHNGEISASRSEPTRTDEERDTDTIHTLSCYVASSSKASRRIEHPCEGKRKCLPIKWPPTAD